VTILTRLFGRPEARKAVYGGPALVAYQSGITLSASGIDWQTRARAYLDAYRVGWFYKAGSRISGDFADLDWTLSYEDSEGDNAEEIVAAPGSVPFARLDPLERFLRLAERPNEWQTGRVFRAQQQIRLDFTGRAIVYLEGGDGGGLPTALLGISPCRMWKAADARGNLVGWVLDKDRPGGGVPFTRDEIVVIEYPGPEEDPVGVVEAVYPYSVLTKQLPQHTSDVLATGGRLAGMAWPKERSLSEDEFADAQRAWRNVTSDPNAARRLLLFPEPMEYQAGAATPSEIGIPELAALTRDEILTAFPIAPEMLMVPMATGLNSGQTQVAVEERYWSGTMHPRVETWEDALQQALIPRYEAAVGRPLDFDIEEPNLDNALSLTEKAEAYKGLVAIGFDPKEAVAAVGLDHIRWNGLPDLLDPAKQAMAQEEARQAQAEAMARPAPDAPTRPMMAPPTKAETVKARREQTVGREFPGFRAAMADFLREQRDRIAADVERVLGPKTKAERKAAGDVDEWWDGPREDRLLTETMRGLYVRLARSALQVVADDRETMLVKQQVAKITEAMLARAASRITGINETTRAAVAEQVSEGVRRGYSITQIVKGVADESYRGIANVSAFDESRSELVARTETMLAYNEANLRGYQEMGVERFEALDGDFDEECETRNGQTFSIEEALEIEDHPNGTLDWIPLDEDGKSSDLGWREFAMKALDALAAPREPQPAPVFSLTVPPASQPVTVNVPEQAAPIVNVAAAEAPIVNVTMPEQPTPMVVVNTPDQLPPIVNVTNLPPNVEAPSVVVSPPEVHVEAPVVNVTVPQPKPTRRTVERDARGQIVSITDGE
jgi:hypothetical protein